MALGIYPGDWAAGVPFGRRWWFSMLTPGVQSREVEVD
jgi:hypothetical protein